MVGLAGLYQLTPLKRVCLDHCRSPFGFVMQHWREGYGGALRMGVVHGLYCLGCCWALFAVLVATGVMSLAWMLLLTLVVFAEKVLPFGRRASQWSGWPSSCWGSWWLSGSSTSPGSSDAPRRWSLLRGSRPPSHPSSPCRFAKRSCRCSVPPNPAALISPSRSRWRTWSQRRFYRHLEVKLDLSFVRDRARELYAERGRPCIDPVGFFKLQLVMFFEGFRSERKLIATASLNLAHRWYLGYALDEDLPDHSSLTRIRQRLGVDIFQRFFERVVDLCRRRD